MAVMSWRWRDAVAGHVRWWSVVGRGSIGRVVRVSHWGRVAWVSGVLVVWSVVRVRRRGVHWTRRSPCARVRGISVARTSVHGRLVSSVGVIGRAHGSAGHGRDCALFVNSRFGVHALLRTDVTKLRVVGRLHQMLRLLGGARVVADEVQVLAVVGGD